MISVEGLKVEFNATPLWSLYYLLIVALWGNGGS